MEALFDKDSDLIRAVESCLETAIALTGAAKGNIQLFDEFTRTFKIFVHRGFDQRFLEYFESVDAESASACGAALRAGERIAVEDVLESPIFKGTHSQQLLLDANVRAVQSAPLVSTLGRVVGVLSTHFERPHQISTQEEQVLDVLARHASELVQRFEAGKTLKESEARYYGLVSAAAEIVWLTDSEGRLQWMSPKWFQLSGQTEAIAGGWGWLEAIHPEDRERVRGAWEYAVRTRTRYEVEWRMLLHDGSSHDFETRAVPIHDRRGDVREWVGIVFDIAERKRHERALRDSEQRFRALVTASSEIVCRMSPDWKQIRYLDVHDFTPDTKNPTRSWIEKYAHPDDQEHVIAIIQDAIRGKKVFELEHRVLNTDGTIGWMFSRAVPILDEKGDILEWFGAAADVTRQKQTEEKLREQARLLSLASDAIIVRDENGKIRYWNNGAEVLYGWKAPAAIGRVTHTLLQTEFPEPLSVIEATVREKNRWTGELVHTCMGGKKVVVASRWVLFYEQNTANTASVMEINTDITEARQAQKALEQNERRLRALAIRLDDRVQERTRELAESVAQTRSQSELLDAANDAIFVRNRLAKITYWNKGAERLYGWTKEEATGKSTGELLKTEFPAPVDEIMNESQQVGWEGELVHTTKQGRRLIVASCWTPLKDDQGDTTGWLTINTDITKRKQAEESARKLGAHLLKSQDDERRRIARELHDSAGQTLTSLSMNLDQLAMMGSLDEQQNALLHDSAQLVDQIAKEIRTISHLLHPPLLDEVGLVSALAWYVEGFEKRSGIKTAVELPPDFGRLSQDAEIALFRVAQECLTNVHRHSGSSTVLVRLQRTVREVQIEVIDQGSGMIHMVSSSGQESMGVGLRGMRERILQLGGDLQVQSGDKGTVVRAILPVMNSSAISATATQEIA